MYGPSELSIEQINTSTGTVTYLHHDQAGWIIEKMQRLRASIARSRETDASALSVNAIGELQGQGPELDRLCGTVCAKRDQIRRLTEILGVEPQ